MKVFFDCEFSDFINSKLIGAGFVAEDGQEHYFELSDIWLPSNCSQFVLESVLPLLENGQAMATEAEAASNLKVWIEGLGQSAVLCSDATRHDWPLITALFDRYDWPENLRRTPSEISHRKPDQAQRYAKALSEYWQTTEVKRHHALIDARALQVAFRASIRRGV